MNKVGLVIEGKQDASLIEACVEAELSRLGIDKPTFEQLQPSLDATGQIESGGWAKVVGWIRNYSDGRVGTFFEPIFENDQPCDMIVVHLDADIHADLFKHIGVNAEIKKDDIVDLVKSIERELTILLNAEEFINKVYFAIPVHKSENWIMAASSFCNDDRWMKEDAKVELRSLFSKERDGSISGMIETIIQEIKVSSDLLYSRAKSYRCFRDHF